MRIRQFLSVMVCVLCGFTASAQVTITSADVGTYLQIGNTIAQNKDTLVTTLDIGKIGSTSWDFSGLASHSLMSLTSVAVSGTPYIGLAPGATHVLKTTISGPFPGVPGTVDADIYLYYTVGNVLERPSTIAGGTLHLPPPFSLDVPASLEDLYVPKDTNYVLPMTLGTTWTSTFTDTTIMLINGGRYSTTYLDHKYSFTVDAYGKMKMPGGGEYDALRIKRIDAAQSGSVAYIFVSKNGASVTAPAYSTAEPDSGVIQISRKNLTWSPPAGPLPVQLSYFRATRTEGGNSVKLTWGTVSETNNYGFDVQRREGASGQFETLPGAFVAGNGTSIVPHAYSYVDQDVPQGIWYYRLRQTDLDGTARYSEAQSVSVTTGVETSTLPLTTSLEQNYPNPFNGYSRIVYTLGSTGRVRIAVMDLLGRQVANLLDDVKPAGNFAVDWNAEGIASGTYVVRMIFEGGPGAGTQQFYRRMTLIR